MKNINKEPDEISTKVKEKTRKLWYKESSDSNFSSNDSSNSSNNNSSKYSDSNNSYIFSKEQLIKLQKVRKKPVKDSENCRENCR